MKKIITLCFILCLSVFAEDERVTQIRDAMVSGDYTNAIPLFDPLIEEQERNIHTLYRYRGVSYFKLNEFEKARADLIKALPGSTGGLVEAMLGETYLKLNDPKNAIVYFDKSIELAEDDESRIALSRYYKGEALASLAKFSEAKAVLLNIDSNEATKDTMEAVRIMIEFCTAKQAEIAEKTANIDDAEGYYDVGYFYSYYGNYEDAVEWYIKAAQQGHAKAQEKLVAIYLKTRGTPQDCAVAYAYAWAIISAQNGSPEANEKLDKLAKILGTEQIELGNLKAKALLEEFPNILKKIPSNQGIDPTSANAQSDVPEG